MAVNEVIVTGRKLRKLIDDKTKLWQRISIWTKAIDVEFDDGSTLQNKLGVISGVTDSLAATSSNVALSAAAGRNLQNQITALNTQVSSLQAQMANLGTQVTYSVNGNTLTITPK